LRLIGLAIDHNTFYFALLTEAKLDQNHSDNDIAFEHLLPETLDVEQRQDIIQQHQHDRPSNTGSDDSVTDGWKEPTIMEADMTFSSKSASWVGCICQLRMLAENPGTKR